LEKQSHFRPNLPIAPGGHFEYALPYLEVVVVRAAEFASPPRQRVPSSENRDWWWQAAVLLVLIGSLYYSILYRLMKAWDDPNFSHGFIVPVFSLYVLWLERSKLARLPRRPSWWGLVIIVFSLVVLVVGVLGAELFLSRISFLLLIAGLVVFFYGWQYFRAVLFPWAFLFLMVPITQIALSQVTFPLQLFASKCAAATLPLFNVPVLRTGNILALAAMRLEVVEACSGIRSLLSLIALAIIYGYWTETRIWIRIALVIASVPIAIFANALRIVGTGLIVQYWDPSKADGFYHLFQGWLIFVVSLILLYAVHQVLRKIAGRESPA
jgi:exosortase